MFRITEEVIEAPDTAGLNDRAGAYVVFEGRVRNHNDGQAVEALEYEAYGELAEKEGSKIIGEAFRKFQILEAACVHRVGTLAINDIAVRVEVASAHRKDAFLACEFIIDEVKKRVPIWKKEHYESGVTGWINCHTEAAADHEAKYYARQITLPEVGLAGQEKLRRSKVLVVGAGGLGSPVLLYLAAAGVGVLGVADGDEVTLSNLHRQVLYRTADVGRPKTEVATERLMALNPHIEVNTHEAITSQNAEEIFRQYDLVIDGTDNFRTKFLLNDAAVLTGTPLIQASIYQYEGQLLLIDSANGGPCLRCTWPQTPSEGCVGNCAEVGVLGAVPGVFGSLQAAEALKFLLGLPTETKEQLLIIDLLGHEVTKIRRKKNPTCPACGSDADLKLTGREPWEADAESDLSVFRMVDIREDDEREADMLPNAVAMPLSRFGVEKFDPGRPYLLVCAKGVRSGRLAKQLHEQGWTNFLSLPGGAPIVQRLARK